MVGPGGGPDSYRLLPGSILVDAGLPASRLGPGLGAQDHFGGEVPRGRAPDVGIHELQ
jgi:hypothetical protein